MIFHPNQFLHLFISWSGMANLPSVAVGSPFVLVGKRRIYTCVYIWFNIHTKVHANVYNDILVWAFTGEKIPKTCPFRSSSGAGWSRNAPEVSNLSEQMENSGHKFGMERPRGAWVQPGFNRLIFVLDDDGTQKKGKVETNNVQSRW